MCRNCNAFSWNNNYLVADAASFGDVVTAAQLSAVGLVAGSHATALTADGIGDAPPPTLALAPVTVTTDNVPDGITGTNPVITVGGPHIISTIDTPGDQDFFKVELQGGVKYNIGMYGHPGGPSGVPQFDSYIELYDALGNRIAYEDGKGRTPSGEIYGLDAMLTITVATTGTYYINARAFEQDLDTDTTTTGDTIGDYDLFVEVNTDPPEPVDSQYYPMTSPLRAIDWGTQVDGTVRNPDGNEGTAPTGNPAGTPDAKGATVGYWGQSTDGKNVIKIYFAKAGDVYSPEDPTSPGIPPAIVAVGAKDYEVTAIWISLREFEKVADIVYVETQNRAEADFHYVTYSGTPGTAGTPSLLGSMNPPQESDEGLAQFNSGDFRWNATNLQQGGFSFVTLIHEFGHGHGLAHPHDTGGNSTIMPGVKPVINTPAGPVVDPTGNYPNYTRGDHDLNQGVFTMMSYQDGWETSPYGRAATDVGYGYLGGLGALDIAVIQSKYGVNEEWATGNDVYVLKDENAAGTFYSSIWDGGGTDEIRYNGARDSSIDLRAATLQYEVGGGGWVSYAWGIHGGFTIAKGVTIENATTGSGNDSLRGNLSDNVLDGGAGNDLFRLQDGGIDTAIGGLGNDGFYFGGAYTAADMVDGGEGRDQVALQGDYALILGALTSISDLILLSGTDTRFGDPGTGLNDYALTSIDSTVAAGATLLVDGSQLVAGETVTFNGSAETDGKFILSAGSGVDRLTGGAGADGFFFRDGTFWGPNDKVTGGANDQIGFRGDFTGANKVVMGADQITGVVTLVLMSGTDTRFGPAVAPTKFDIQMHDGNVGAGQRFTIDGTFLTSDETMRIDGALETNGFFRMFGGSGADVLIGGAGNDLLRGNGGGDALTGNGGSDRFVYGSASDSTGTGFDLLSDLKSAEDLLDLHSAVTGWSASVGSGQLGQSSFDADLAAALDGALDAGRAILFDPDAGTYAGRHFLIVDANGDGAYTAGADYVFELGSAAIVDTSGSAFFV